jgi:hypothetical protein
MKDIISLESSKVIAALLPYVHAAKEDGFDIIVTYLEPNSSKDPEKIKVDIPAINKGFAIDSKKMAANSDKDIDIMIARTFQKIFA